MHRHLGEGHLGRREARPVGLAPALRVEGEPPDPYRPRSGRQLVGLVVDAVTRQLGADARDVGEAIRPARDRLVRGAEPGDREAPVRLLPAEPAIGREPSGEDGGGRVGDVNRDGDADEPPAVSVLGGEGLEGGQSFGRRANHRPGWRLCTRYAYRRAKSGYWSGFVLVIATSPVRAISISPCGRTMRSNESICS